MLISNQVSTQEAQEFAQKIGAPFFETSAKARINVEEGFYSLVREIRKWNSMAHDEEEGKDKKKEKKGGSKLKLPAKCTIL